MRKRYRMFRRKGVFYVQDNQSGKQESLHTRIRADAERLCHARNEAAQGPLLNRDLGRVYLSASDPDAPKRTWSAAMEELRSHGRFSTQLRYDRAMRDAALAGIRDKPIVETNPADLLAALRSGTRCTNHYFRRLHNPAIGLGWLNWPLLAPKMWPKVKWRNKRGITKEEHPRIASTECNPERRLYYDLLWETGGSQSDVASLTGDNIDWGNRILWFHRGKLKPEAEPATVDSLRQFTNTMAQARGQKTRRQLWDDLLWTIARDLVPLRPGWREPRAVKHRPKPLPLLTRPRHLFQDRIPYSRWLRRKSASKNRCLI